jgi:AmiR/NasT family two-component response regulator
MQLLNHWLSNAQRDQDPEAFKILQEKAMDLSVKISQTSECFQ